MMLTAVPVHADTVPLAAAEQGAPVVATEPARPGDPASPPMLPIPVPAPPETGGEAVVTARSRVGDPLQDFNVASFNVAQDIDRAVLAPTSRAYQKVVPQSVRTGFGNFLKNLREPVVFVNFLLQLKIGKAAETAGRFAINSTIGVAGVMDVAKKKPFYLPGRRNSFANTLGFYGVKPGPFFFAPLLGPTTLRDLFGNIMDQVVPIGPVQPFRGRATTLPIAVLSSLDYRAEFDVELERQRATEDPYMAARRYYLERRQAEIDALKGRKRMKAPLSTSPVVPKPERAAAVPPPAVIGPPA